MAAEYQQRLIVGVSGEIGVGKTTAIDAVLGVLTDCVQYEFARPLKQIGVILGFAYQEVYGTQEEKLRVNSDWGVSGRQWMQLFGTEICRDTLPKIFPESAFAQRLWVNLFKKFAEKTASHIVVSDVRRSDEAAAIRELGGIVIGITRPNSDGKTPEAFRQHISETGIAEVVCDYNVVNDGTLDEFRQKVAECVRKAVAEQAAAAV